MRTNRTKKYLFLSFLCCFLFLMVPSRVHAQTWQEVGTWNELVEALERDTMETKHIKITQKIDIVTEHTDIDPEIQKNQKSDLAYWKYTDGLVKVKGNVSLDLNGKLVSYKWCAKESGCLFLLEKGCNMTVLDSSAKQDGMIYFNGWAEQWNHPWFGLESENAENTDYMTHIYKEQYKNKAQRRDVFHVSEGASLTLNSGTIRAGRGERQWATGYSAGYLTGWVWMIINGSPVITEYDSTFVMNGGRLDANGNAFIYEAPEDQLFKIHHYEVSGCVLFKDGSHVIINDGYLRGANNASFLSPIYGRRRDINGIEINGGHFEACTEGPIVGQVCFISPFFRVRFMMNSILRILIPN